MIEKGYPKLAGLSKKQFLKHVSPLERKLSALKASNSEGRLPFVIVIKSELADPAKAMRRVARNGKAGVVSMKPVAPSSFSPIDGLKLPKTAAYILADIDRGGETLNITPEKALRMIKRKRRSPLTIEEGVAVVTHFLEFLQKNNCFSLLGSRRGDQRVPALWLSGGAPKLGWCWDRNPHTWLGSASCGARV